MMRLFIAFPLESRVREALARIANEFKPLARSVRWVKPEQIHLTARFLGDTDPRLVASISDAVANTSRQFAPIDSHIDRLGGFPNLNRPKVIWAGLNDASRNLFPIVDHLNLELAKLKIKLEDKRFKPHLTLGRIKEPRDLGALPESLQAYSFQPIPIRFDSLELIHSTLTPKGPIYKTLISGRMAERFE